MHKIVGSQLELSSINQVGCRLLFHPLKELFEAILQIDFWFVTKQIASPGDVCNTMPDVAS